MGRKLVFDIFSPAELMKCATGPGKPGRHQRPLVDENKIRLVLGMQKFCMFILISLFISHTTDEVRKIFPAGWNETDMLRRMNQAFID